MNHIVTCPLLVILLLVFWLSSKNFEQKCTVEVEELEGLSLKYQNLQELSLFRQYSNHEKTYGWQDRWNEQNLKCNILEPREKYIWNDSCLLEMPSHLDHSNVDDHLNQD